MFTIVDAPELFEQLKENLTASGLVRLIKLHMPLASGMAKKFARRHERQPDDYIGVAYLAVVEAVHNAFKYMTHHKITPYIVVYIKRAMLKFFREDRTVAIPTHMQDRLFRLGYLIRIEVRPLVQEDVSTITNNDLLDALIELLPDLIDRQVLQLRLEGHTDKEIGCLLNKEVKEIRGIRKHLKDVLLDVLEDDE